MDVMSLRRMVMTQMPKGAWKKLYSGEIQCTTTSGDITNVEQFVLDGAYTDGKIIYCRTRDKAGKRNGYYYGGDSFAIKGINCGISVYNYNNDVLSVASATFGLYLRIISSGNIVTIASRYNANTTRTIDGTYTVEIYQLDWPDDSSPFTE